MGAPLGSTIETGASSDPQRLVNRLFINVPIDANSVDRWVHVVEAGRTYELVSISEIHAVAASDAGAVTLNVRVDPAAGTEGPHEGRTLLASTFDLKSTANTIVKKTAGDGLTATLADRGLIAGDKISLDFTGTLTALAGGIVVIELQPY